MQLYKSLNPVANHAELLTGVVGQVQGVTLYTDAYSHSELQVVNQNALYVFARDTTGRITKAIHTYIVA
jgi:hypothetical protein